MNEGWLLNPVPISSDGKPLLWNSKQYNVSFRFGVLQADKLRACDDLKHSMANLACTAATPIQLLSWGNIAQISAILAAGGGDWATFKDDRKAAYKQLPIDPADQNTAIIALRRPTNHRWYGFIARALIFGSVSAVLHYNVLPRLMVVLANRYLGIPLVGYFDDFAAIIRKVLGKASLDTFARSCALLGFQLKGEKSQVGPAVASLGLLGVTPFQANGWKLPISPPGEKRAKWTDLRFNYLKEGRIPHRCLEKITGRLLFSQTAIFGKFSRAQLRPMYQKFHIRSFSATLSPYEKSVFRWRKEVIAERTPRTAAPRPRRPLWIVYTDAATNPPMMCALLFTGTARPLICTLLALLGPLRFGRISAATRR